MEDDQEFLDTNAAISLSVLQTLRCHQMLIDNHLDGSWNSPPKIIRSLKFKHHASFAVSLSDLDGTNGSRLPTITFTQSLLLGGLKAVNILALRSEFNTPDETFPLLAHRRK